MFLASLWYSLWVRRSHHVPLVLSLGKLVRLSLWYWLYSWHIVVGGERERRKVCVWEREREREREGERKRGKVRERERERALFTAGLQGGSAGMTCSESFEIEDPTLPISMVWFIRSSQALAESSSKLKTQSHGKGDHGDGDFSPIRCTRVAPSLIILQHQETSNTRSKRRQSSIGKGKAEVQTDSGKDKVKKRTTTPSVISLQKKRCWLGDYCEQKPNVLIQN